MKIGYVKAVLQDDKKCSLHDKNFVRGTKDDDKKFVNGGERQGLRAPGARSAAPRSRLRVPAARSAELNVRRPAPGARNPGPAARSADFGAAFLTPVPRS